MGEVMLSSAIGIVALMVTTWIVSLIKKNASIVDIVWGLGDACADARVLSATSKVGLTALA